MEELRGWIIGGCGCSMPEGTNRDDVYEAKQAQGSKNDVNDDS